MSIARRSSMMLVSLALLGCGLVSFDIEQPIPEQTVQGGLLSVLPAGLFDIPLNIDIESQTKSRGTGPASRANLREVSLAITDPADETFEFLDTITITMSGAGLPDVVVAQLPDVPAQARISLNVVPSVDLLPYIKAGAKMKASATGHMPRRTLRFNGKVVVTVKV